jgi:hypothetical protein
MEKPLGNKMSSRKRSRIRKMMLGIIYPDRYFFKEWLPFFEEGSAYGKNILTKMTFGIDAGVTHM